MEALDRLKPGHRVEVFPTRASSAEELVDRLQGAQALINVRSYSRFDRETLSRLPELRLISVLGTGTDNIDLQAANDLGILICNVPGASTTAVAEMAIGLMLAVAKRLVLADRDVRNRNWTAHVGLELEGKTLGVVGLGLIGQKLAHLARGLGMRVVGWSLTRDAERARACGVQLVELEELYRQADVISLHLRLSEQTAGMIGEREIGLMKPTAILINTARGGLVDQDALVSALQTSRIFGAGLDVYPTEPLPHDSPLRQLERVVLSPHLAWLTEEASERLRQQPVANILAWLEGQPINVCNPPAVAHPRQAQPGGRQE